MAEPGLIKAIGSMAPTAGETQEPVAAPGAAGSLQDWQRLRRCLWLAHRLLVGSATGSGNDGKSEPCRRIFTGETIGTRSPYSVTSSLKHEPVLRVTGKDLMPASVCGKKSLGRPCSRFRSGSQLACWFLRRLQSPPAPKLQPSLQKRR